MATRRFIPALACGLLLALAGCGSSSSSSTQSTGSTAPASTSTTSTTAGPQVGFEGVPIEQGVELAPASTTGTAPVDGIRCAPLEQLVYHIHAHLAVYDNGELRPLPGGVGIPGSRVLQTTEGPVALGGKCYYWLHTHAPDGIIHIESPVRRVYSLGEFFDEWHQPLSTNQVATVHGRITALVNGKVWTQGPRAIPLIPHEVIQLNIGQPAVPFHAMSWKGLAL